MNFAGFFVALLRLLYLIFFSSQIYTLQDILVNALPVAGCLLMMVFMLANTFKINTFFSFLFFPLILLYITITFHDRGVLSFFIPYLIYPFFFLNKKRKVIIFFMLSGLFYVISFVAEGSRLYGTQSRHNVSLEIISIIGSLILTFISLYSIKSQAWQYEKKILSQKNELERINEEIRQQQEKLIESNLTKDKLFSIISHDLRTPILSLQLFLDHENTEEALRKLLSILPEMKAELKKTSDLFDNLLGWARLQLREANVSLQKIDLSSVASKVKETLDERARQKGIDITIDISDKFVYSDRSILDIVLRNLVSNAIKFTKKDGIISIKGVRKGGFYILQVEDNGIGIDGAAMQQISGKNFYSSPGTGNEQGTGLGLIICKDLIERCQGDIAIFSRKGKGTRISVCLPQDQP